MNNELTKNQNRYLRTEYGQSYAPAIPEQPGYWRTLHQANQKAWARVTRVESAMGSNWSISLRWYDRFKFKNMSWYGQASIRQPIQIPHLLRYVNGYEEIQIDAPAKAVQVWIEPTPAVPEQPYIPDKHIYEDNTGWNGGARAIKLIQRGMALRWKFAPMARGVAVGLCAEPAQGAFWQYPIGVLATSGAAQVVVLGTEVQSLGIFTAETVFCIERVNGNVSVYVDDVLRYTAQDTTTSTLMMDVSLYAPGDSVNSPSVSVIGPGPEPGGEGEAAGQLTGIYGFAADSDDYSFTTGQLSPLLGHALGFVDLPVLGNPVYMYAPLPRMAAQDEPVSMGALEFSAPFITGLASDDDVAMAHGNLPLGLIYAEGDDADEGSMHMRARVSSGLRGQSIQVVSMRERLAAMMSLGATHITMAAVIERVRATDALTGSSTSNVAMAIAARIVSGAASTLPHQDGDTLTRVCHESGGFVTEYTGYNFQSFAKIGGKYYGVAADGVYLLEGDTDDGREITAHIDLGTHDFATGALKSMPTAYAGIASQAPATLITKTRQGEFRYLQRGFNEHLQVQRFDLGRGLRDTHYDLAIEAQAQGLQLQNMEFEVNPSKRKI